MRSKRGGGKSSGKKEMDSNVSSNFDDLLNATEDMIPVEEKIKFQSTSPFTLNRKTEREERKQKTLRLDDSGNVSIPRVFN